MNTVALTLFVLALSSALAYPLVYDATIINGNSVVPPSGSHAVGSLRIIVAEDQQTAVFNLITNITGTIQSILIRDGKTSQRSNVTYLDLTSFQPITSKQISTTQTNYTFNSFTRQLIPETPDVVPNLNIEIKSNTDTIRGQIFLSGLYFIAEMSPNMTYPVNPDGSVTGKADILLSIDQNSFIINYVQNVTNANRSMLAKGAVQSSTGTPDFELSNTLPSANAVVLTAANGTGVNSLANLRSSLLTNDGLTYIQIAVGSSGKLRGYFNKQPYPTYKLPSLTPSASLSASVTPSITRTPSISKSATPSRSRTPSLTATPSSSATMSVSRSRSVSPSRSPSKSVSHSSSASVSRTNSPGASISRTGSISRTKSVSRSRSSSVSRSVSQSFIPSSLIPSVAPTNSPAVNLTATAVPSSTPISFSASPSFGAPPSASASASTPIVVDGSVDGVDGADGNDSGNAAFVKSWISLLF